MIKLIKSTFFNESQTKKELAEFILNSEILSMNNQCLIFEKNFAKKQGRKYAVFVSNGSVANLLLIQALLNDGRLKKGDKVGFSALTWPTNVMPLIQLGLEPIAIDCEINSLNISPKILSGHLDRIQALFLTNVLGFSDDIHKIREQCASKGVLLIEDNCESLGSAVGEELLGNFGLASTFSFFVGHHMSTIEGGMICTDDEKLKDCLVMSRAHGWDRNLDTNKQKDIRNINKVDDFYSKYTFYDIASNFRPTEINGFLGNSQIKHWDEIVETRENNFQLFHKAALTNDDIMTLEISHMSKVSNFAMPLIFKDEKTAKIYRNKFIHEGVEIRPVIAGNMERQPFFTKYVKSSGSCNNADLIHQNGFYFGNNPEMTNEELNILCDLVKGSR